MPQKKKPLSAMLGLLKANWLYALGSMLSMVMIVIIGFLTPLLLAEIIDCVLAYSPAQRDLPRP